MTRSGGDARIPCEGGLGVRGLLDDSLLELFRATRALADGRVVVHNEDPAETVHDPYLRDPLPPAP